MEREPIEVCGVRVFPGARVEVRLKLSELYVGGDLETPVYVLHGREPGPVVFVTAAIHGDEINGVEAVRRLLRRVDPVRLRGSLLLVPVANLPAFLAHRRDAPDGRDLNRTFPGSKKGSQAARLARRLWDDVVALCHFGIDLHTAGRFRTNVPHVRAELANDEVRRMASAFGTRVVLDHPGTPGSLRQEATKRGIPTILFEGGEVLKFQRSVVSVAVSGVLNVLAELGLLESKRRAATFRVMGKRSSWVRPGVGGIVDLRVKAGQLVAKDKVLAYVRPPFGRAFEVLRAPFPGVVIGASTRPLAMPGEAVVHLVRLDRTFAQAKRAWGRRAA